MIRFFIISLTMWCSASLFSQEIKVTSGSIQLFDNFPSKFVDARNVYVWLPDGYSAQEKYPVLYMHDGQMLFDAEQTWNKQAWEVDEVAGKLMAEKKTKNFIVVGICNNGLKRHCEYFPQKAYEKLNAKQKEFISNILVNKGKIAAPFAPISDAYLQFLVAELKPFIDSTFSTKTDRDNTFISGSSMGGLISIYAICEYPEVFGGAACLSTHWTGIYQIEKNPIPKVLFEYINEKLPDPKKHKIYFDYGNQTLDALYPTLQQRVDVIMRDHKYTRENWRTEFFPERDHSEKSWHDRLDVPLQFLFKIKTY